MSGFLSWWDSFELWLSGLGFVPQSLLVMPAVLALAFGIALGIDAALDGGYRVLRRMRGDRGSGR